MRIKLWVTVFSLTTAFLPQTYAASAGLGSPIALKAWNELQKNSPKTFSKNQPNVSFVVAPNSDPKKVKIAENQMLFMLHYYEKYIPPKTPITIWIWDSEKDRAWYDAAIRAGLTKGSYESLNLDARHDSGTSGPSQDGSQGMELLEIELVSDQYPYVLYHELTHISQMSLASGKNMPCWVREGMATYNGFAIESRISQSVYINSMTRIIQRGLAYAAGETDYKTTKPQFWIDYFKDNETRPVSKCKEPQDYATGAMGIQYLVGTYGFDKIYKFLSGLDAAWKPECKADNVDIVPCSSWKDVFTKTFGVSPENAYTGFGKFIVEQIAWGQKQKIQTEDVLRNKYPQNYVVSEFKVPATQIRAGTPCAKENEVATANKVKVTCMKVSDFLFWSVSPVASSSQGQQPSDNNSLAQTATQSQAPKTAPAQNPDEVFGPGGLCEIEGQYLPTEMGEVLLCTSSGGKLRWAATPDPLPTNGIYPGMKCETLGTVISGANGKSVQCSSLKGKNVWMYKS
jgi:hypothetical protein